MQSLPFLQFTGIVLMCYFYPAVKSSEIKVLMGRKFVVWSTDAYVTVWMVSCNGGLKSIPGYT